MSNATTKFTPGDKAVFTPEQGATIVVTVAAVTTWLEGFQPPVEYVACDGDGSLLTVRPERLRPLDRVAEASNVVSFPPRTIPAGPDDWRLQVLQDALHDVTRDAKDLADGRRIARLALVETCGGDAA